jgi:uncharacterized protein VirK/YbjX
MLDGVGLVLKTFAAEIEFAGVRAALALCAEDHIYCDAARRRRRSADVDEVWQRYAGKRAISIRSSLIAPSG